DGLDGESRRLMDDPNVNDHGVYTGVETIVIPKLGRDAGCILIHVVQSAIDQLYRAASSVELRADAGNSSSLPSVHDTGFSSRRYAVRTESQVVLSDLKELLREKRLHGVQEARLKKAIIAMEDF